MRKYRNHPFFRALQNFVTFFLLVAFIVTCSMMLFVSVMQDSMGLVLTKENIEVAAQLNFINVLLIAIVAAECGKALLPQARQCPGGLLRIL